jgi:hypothetical protein
MADENLAPVQNPEDSPALPSEREYPRMTFPAPGLSRIDTFAPSGPVNRKPEAIKIQHIGV